MNKIILILSLAFFSSGLQAQQLNSQIPATAKKMTVEEANALNGKADPTINGKPYSQYKAEQEALKNKQQAQSASQSNSPKVQAVNANPGDLKETSPAPVKNEAEIKAPAQKPAVQKGSGK